MILVAIEILYVTPISSAGAWKKKVMTLLTWNLTKTGMGRECGKWKMEKRKWKMEKEKYRREGMLWGVVRGGGLGASRTGTGGATQSQITGFSDQNLPGNRDLLLDRLRKPPG